MPNNCQTFFECKKGLVCNLLLWWRSRNKSTSEKGQKHHRKVVQRRSTEETEKVLSETTPCHWFITCPSSTWQYPRSYLHNSYCIFEERKSNCFASPPPPPPYSPDPAPCDFFCFQNWDHSLLDGNTSPDRHMDLPFISTLLLCPNQRTVAPSRSGYIGWNFAFLATGSTSRAWNEHFWANLKFKVSR